MGDKGNAAAALTRPVTILQLDKPAAPLIKGSSAGYNAISKDFSGLFADNIEWIAAALATPQVGVI